MNPQEIISVEREFIDAYVAFKLERPVRGKTKAGLRFAKARTQLFAKIFGYGDVAKMLNERELEAIVNSRIQEEQTKQDPT